MLFIVLISMPTIRPAQAYVTQWTWLPPYVSKVDGSYVAYRNGSTAKIVIPVYNDIVGAVNGLNVSKVIVSFDWGGATSNKTLDLSASPVKINWHTTSTFTVSFTADATEAVSSSWRHTYTVYVENVNASGVKTITLSIPWDYFGSSNRWMYVVYSTSQSNALDLQVQYNAYANSYPLTYFTDTSAKQLAGQAQMEGTIAGNYYTSSQDYTSSNTHYQNALNLYSSALTAQASYGTKVQDANLNATLTQNLLAKAEANAALVAATAILNQSYAYMLFGIGFVIISIGLLIYLAKRPRT